MASSSTPSAARKLITASHLPVDLHIPELSFDIPPFPEACRKVIEPRDIRLSRLPPPGYDMRTLRKQVEGLHREIEQRIEAQEEMYLQNHMLWDYVKSLYIANKNNAKALREHFTMLQKELLQVHQERSRLAKQLKKGLEGEKLLKVLKEEQELEEKGILDETRLKEEAVNALAKARGENNHLQDTLKSYIDKLANAQTELEDLRYQRIEDDNDEAADIFRNTNKAVLRVAYMRFLASVQSRIKGTKLGLAVLVVYKSLLRKKYWSLWIHFMLRKEFARCSRIRRASEVAIVCLQQWKVYTVLEKHFQRTKRRKLLKSTFKSWSKVISEKQWEEWSEGRILYFDERCLKRKMFRTWKANVVFLQWNSSRTCLLMEHAEKHHIATIIAHWKNVVHMKRMEENHLSYQISYGLKLGLHFALWKQSCEIRWKRRGKLVRRFLLNCRGLIKNRKNENYLLNRGIMNEVGTKKSRAFKLWRNHALHALKFKHAYSRQSTLTRYKQRSIYRESILMLQHCVAVRKRLAYYRQAASTHYVFRMARVGFMSFASSLNFERRRKFEMVEDDLRKFFLCWKSSMPMLIKENNAEKYSQRVQRKHRFWLLKKDFQLMKQIIKRKFRMERLKESIKLSLTFKLQKRCFQNWVRMFSSQIYWKSRELMVDMHHSKQLAQIKEQDFEALVKEKEDLCSNIQDLQATLKANEKALALKEHDIFEKEKLILDRNKEKIELEGKLKDAQQNLDAKQKERDRFALDDIKRQELLDTEQAKLQQMQINHDNAVSNLKQDIDRLRDELKKSKEETRKVKEQADMKSKQDAEAIKSQEELNEALSKEIIAKDTAVEQLERDKISTKKEIEHVQNRLKELTVDGCALLEDGESNVRKKMSVVRGLRQSAGQTEARVLELRSLVSEKKGELNLIHQERNRSLNNREIRDYEEEVNSRTQVSFNANTPITQSNMKHDSRDSSLDEYLKSITPQPTSWSGDKNEGTDNLRISSIMECTSFDGKHSTHSLQAPVDAKISHRTDFKLNKMLNSDSDSDDDGESVDGKGTDVSTDDDGVVSSNRNVARMKIHQLTARFSS